MNAAGSTQDRARDKVKPPLWLLTELTYKCPLHCVYCSNPVDYAKYRDELSTEEWIRVLTEARRLGAAQLGFSGGEPLMRNDLEVLIREARTLGYYSNLITSGIGLTEKRVAAFKEAGLDHIQLSFQDSTREMNDFLSSTRTFDLKNKVAKLIRQYEYPMVLNVVLHRLNIDHIEKILAMAEQMGVEYLELANTQYYGWGFLNRDQLMPTRAQLELAEAATNRFREKIGDRMRIFFVVPDYHANRPKACMNGWGSVFITVTPDGVVLPCHEARMLPGLTFPSVREASMEWIWYDSPAFHRYRGDDWMKEPCRSCPEKIRDFGGCRCQAYMLTGDATNADPVCDLSPHHHLVVEAIEQAEHRPPINVKPLVFRLDANSRELIGT
jgi:PqqA peptide cyclase